jgi:uncharacterized membrane protein
MKLMARLLLIALLAAVLLSAQQITGTVTGIATDPSGALLSGVQVQLKNLQTNVTRDATTDAGGVYSIPFLPAGSYSLSASAAGFRTYQVESFTLQVGQTARLDLPLRLGDVTQTISVSGEAAVLQTESASVGAVIDGSKIVDLPLNGRNFVHLGTSRPWFHRRDVVRIRRDRDVGERRT